MTAADGNDRYNLEFHSNIFVCVLYRRAKGIIDRSFDSDKVFDGLKMEGFPDRQQARAELVQFLQQEQPSRINYDRNDNTVKLTQQDVYWAKQQCDKAPYTNYP